MEPKCKESFHLNKNELLQSQFLDLAQFIAM